MIVQNHCIILQRSHGYGRRERRSRMDSLDLQQGAYEAQRAQANRAELVERIARAICEDGRIEPLKGLFLNRCSAPTKSAHGVSDPSFCVIAQGSKEIFLGK